MTRLPHPHRWMAGFLKSSPRKFLVVALLAIWYVMVLYNGLLRLPRGGRGHTSRTGRVVRRPEAHGGWRQVLASWNPHYIVSLPTVTVWYPYKVLIQTMYVLKCVLANPLRAKLLKHSILSTSDGLWVPFTLVDAVSCWGRGSKPLPRPSEVQDVGGGLPGAAAGAGGGGDGGREPAPASVRQAHLGPPIPGPGHGSQTLVCGGRSTGSKAAGELLKRAVLMVSLWK